MPPQVIQQRAEVRARVDNQEKDCVCGNGGDDGVTALVFNDGGREGPTSGGLANAFGGGYDRGRQRGQMFAVEVTICSRVYEETVPTQNHYRLDSFALREGPHEVVYGGQ